MKQKIFLTLFITAILLIPAFGQDNEGPVVSTDSTYIGVVASLNTSSIQLLDPMSQTVSPVYLKGVFGSGGLLDVAITSDGKTALVSNFGSSSIFFLDISQGVSVEPTILGVVSVGMFAEDIAITPDNKFALVTDGGLSSQISVVDIENMMLVFTKNLGGKDAQAIAIAPDGETVVVADYLGGRIHVLLLEPTGVLRYSESHSVIPLWPVNISISPDGKTIIVPTAFQKIIPVLGVSSTPGQLYNYGYIVIPKGGSQSCVFSADGTKAYLLNNQNSGQGGTQILIMDVTGPGQVSYTGTSIQVEPTRGSGQFFGVDTMAMDPSGKYLYLTNPTSFGVVAEVSVIDLETNTQILSIPTVGIPTGIAFGTMMPEDPVENIEE